MRRAIIALLTVLVVASVGASWTAVFLLHRASEARADAALRAEARTELVREDLDELLGELRDPAADTRRDDLWQTARRIELKVDQALEHLEP